MSFEDRIERQRRVLSEQEQAAESSKKERELEVEGAKQKSEQQRLSEKQADPRYTEMVKMANSSELHKALIAYVRRFYHLASPTITISHGIDERKTNEPLGQICVSIIIDSGEGTYTDAYGNTQSNQSSGIQVSITWRQSPEKRLKFEGRFGSVWNGGSSRGGFRGENAKSGLGMKFMEEGGFRSEERGPLVFHDLESLLDHIAQRIIEKEKFNKEMDERNKRR